MTQRRRQLEGKRSSNVTNENSNGHSNVQAAAAAAAAAARRRQHYRHHPATNRSKFDYLYRSLLKKKFPINIPPNVILIVFVVIFALISYRLIDFFIAYRSQIEYTNVPSPLPRLIHPNDTGAERSPTRFWGTYRSNLYFGLKHRSSRSLSAGLMWFDYQTLRDSPSKFVRHWCDHNDPLKFGWTSHDGENFGVEQIQDEQFQFNVQFVKDVHGEHGGDWTSRIQIQTNNRTATPISVFFYFHHDLPWIDEISRSKSAGPQIVTIRGQTAELDGFSIQIQPNQPQTPFLLRTLTDVFTLDKIHQEILPKFSLEQNFYLLTEQNLKDFQHNTLIVQLTIPQVPVGQAFSFDVVFQSDSSNRFRTEDLTGTFFTEQLTKFQKQFDERFENIFQLKTKQNFDTKKIQFAKSTLSNLLGGISFFTGQSLVAKSPDQKSPDLYWTTNLYTAVPSRSFFPRGFLWDEGFHNLLIARWNRNITMEILSHWLDLLNNNGWIPREVILGDEARARVPSEFVVQYTNNANPPTFFLTIDYLLKTPQAHQLFSLPFVQRVEKWYQWYNRTQMGPVPFSYRWRGRNASSIFELNPKTLTSGLDDYPRASHPTETERHLDLRCWMAMASSVIGKLYSLQNRQYEQTENEYLRYAQLLNDNERLDQLHWSDQVGFYADYGYHTDHVQLQRVPVNSNGNRGNAPPQTQMIRQVTRPADLSLKFVKHFGYVSLFPLMTRILHPHSSKLEKLLNDLQNPNLLWTPYGLRSLAQTSSLYDARNTEHDPPYWRGAIWINMNYFVLSALQHYAKVSGPQSDKARQIYVQLRTNLINNLVRIYEKTGLVWEQYNDKTGQGQGTHPFTGWSSLIVLIMSELYDD